MTGRPNKVASQQRPERITQLDGLRGLAIILVIINHLRWQPFLEKNAQLVLLSLVPLGIGVIFLKYYPGSSISKKRVLS